MSQNLFSKIQAELIYIDSLIDLSPDPFPVDNEPVRSFGLGPDAIVFRRENAYKFVKAAEKIHGLSEEICNSLTIKEIESCIVKALRLSRQTNNGITLATAEQFFKEIIAKPFVEWVDIRPLWGATSEKDEVKLGPFTFMTRMNVKQKYPKILNMDILPVEDAEIHVYISCTIKSRTGSRASELAEIQYEKFEGVMAYMFGRPSKDYHVAVFNPRPIFAQRSICISSSGNIEGSSGWKGPQERMNISHDYYLNSKNGNERLWNLLRVQSHSEIERRLLLAIEWIGKGIYDVEGIAPSLLVTGSARLDILRKGGDSLQGRYHFLRLMPLTVNELKLSNNQDVLDLYELSGFPEPYFKASKVGCNRWSRSYRERIVRQEVASNEQFHDLATVEIVFQRLPALVGGLFSANSLSEDIQVDQKTLVKWVNALERLYAIFKVSPFGPPKIKAIKKAQKIFFYDWNAIIEPGHRFENFVAVHLLKWVYFEQDVQGRDLDLRFFRDKYDHEVDFIILENSKPVMFIETKLTDQETSKGLRYLKSKYKNVRALQIHILGKKEYIDGNGIEHCHCLRLLKELV